MRYIDLVVVDQAHIPFMSYEQDFRANLISLRRILKGSQTLFLSATIPPSLATRFRDYYSLFGLKEIRKQTNRPNLRYSVVVQAGGVQKQLGCLRLLLTKHKGFVGFGKIIIYCRSKALAEQVGKDLACLVYHADRGSKERVQTLQKFMEESLVGKNQSRMIAATGALGELPHLAIGVYIVFNFFKPHYVHSGHLSV